MIASFEHKSCYIAPPKTGTSSIYSVLKQFGFEIYSLGDGSGYHDVRFIHTSGTAPRVDREQWFVFASIRNPYSRAVSLWSQYEKTVEPIGFNAFMQRLIDKNCPPVFHHTLNDWIPSSVPRDRLIRVEHIADDMSRILRRFTKRAIKIPHRNISGTRIPLNPERRAMINDWAYADFARFYHDNPAQVV